jgi:UDP-N-acetyl-D-galactosamine dehydrogenase
LQAAGTKWNFLPFKPGLVGGHCIGVDPYYLAYKAQAIGHHPEMILAGRRINDNMGMYVANNVIKLMIKKGIMIKGAKVLVLGITFKENCPDIRNTKVIDIIRELQDFGCVVDVSDPHANPAEVRHEFGLDLIQFTNNNLQFNSYNAVVLAVAHNEFREISDINFDNKIVVFDVKGVLKKADGRL